MEREVIEERGRALVGKLKELIGKGNASRIVIKAKSGKIILNIPVTLVAVGAILAPALSVLAVVLTFVKDCKIEVVKAADKSGTK